MLAPLAQVLLLKADKSGLSRVCGDAQVEPFRKWLRLPRRRGEDLDSSGLQSVLKEWIR
jgi:hypothetical protein